MPGERMIFKFLKYFLATILLYTLICVATPFNKTLRVRSIKNQIHYLSVIMDKGYDDLLQHQFPEGKVFSNALLALSIIEYSEKYGIENEKDANIVDRCIQPMQSFSTLNKFDEHLNPRYGIFLNGWTNFLYSKYLKSELFKHSSIREKILQHGSKIEFNINTALQDSIRPLETYVDAYWPADNFVAAASMRDTIHRANWLKHLQSLSKHESHLLHHVGSNPLEIRGSSNAMITYCLHVMGHNWANSYNANFKSIFIDDFLGIQLVKENADGSDKMDVDSGPFFLGYGASATIMNIKTQAEFKDFNARYTWASMNFIGLPVNVFKHKYYLFKKEPMFDLFMLWAGVSL